MMGRNVLALLRVMRLTSWRTFRERLGTGNSKWGLLLLPLMAIGIIPMIGMIAGLYFLVYVVAQSLGQAHLLLTIALTVGQIICLTFGIFYVISSFYFSKDLPLLVPLPVRPGEILLARFISILAGEYLTMAPLVLPAFVIYGVMAKVSWLFIPMALVIYLLLPIFPLVLSSLFSMVLMRVTNLRANRDMWRVIGGLAGVGIAIGFQYVVRIGNQGGHFDTNFATDQVKQLFEQQQNLIHMTGKYVPTSLWATNALREGAPAFGLGWFLLFAAAAVVALVLLIWLAERLFFGGLLGGDEVRSAGKALTREELARETGQVRTPLWALLQREMKLLNRTPAFLMAAVLPVVLLPVMMGISLSQTGAIDGLLDKIAEVKASPLIPAVGIAVVLFMSAMSNVGATAISREGRYFWISRSLPVAPSVQVQAKLLHGLLFTVFQIVIVLGGIGYLGILTPLTALYVALGGFLAATAGSAGGILIDIARPHLKWTDPQQAMKGNMNVLFTILVTFVMVAILVGAIALLYFMARPLMIPTIVLLFGVLSLVLVRLAGNFADRRYVEYEE